MDSEIESEIITLIKDLQTRIMYLEKKINILISQSSDRSSSPKSYSPGSHSYGKPQRYSDNRENRFGAKGVRSGRPYDKKRSEEGRGYPKKRKPYTPAIKKRSDKSDKK